MSYIGKENTTDTVEGGDHLLVRTVHQAQQGRKGSSAAGRSGRDDVGRYERAPGGQHARR